MFKTFITISTFILSTHVGAAIATGHDLKSGINSDDSTRRLIMMGYIVGAFDSGQKVMHCAPDMKPSKLIEFVKSVVTTAPEADLDRPADFFINVPLSIAYPCSEKTL